MLKVEEYIKIYYKSIKEKSILEYEILVLENNNKKLLECKNNIILTNHDEIEKLINNNEIKIMDKQKKLNDIVEQNAAMEFLINNMDQESQRILELRYKKEKPLQAISLDLNMSKSTVSRKNLKIIDKVARELVIN